MSPPTLTVFVGLPGCGKSTEALRLLVEAARGGRRAVRLGRDALRDGMSTPDTYRRPDTEDAVTIVQRAGIRDLLAAGWDVIVDDTSFRPEFVAWFRAAAADTGARFVLIDMSDVPLETCIERDGRRPWRGYPPWRWEGAQVAEPIIRLMHRTWLAARPACDDNDAVASPDDEDG